MTGLRTKLRRHVRHGHAFLHRQVPNGCPGILDGLIAAAPHAYLATDRQHHVLSRDEGSEMIVPLDENGFRNAKPDFAGRQNTAHLGRADTEHVGAERASGR